SGVARSPDTIEPTLTIAMRMAGCLSFCLRHARKCGPRLAVQRRRGQARHDECEPKRVTAAYQLAPAPPRLMVRRVAKRRVSNHGAATGLAADPSRRKSPLRDDLPSG